MDTDHIPSPQIFGGREINPKVSRIFSLATISAPNCFISPENLLAFSPPGNKKTRKKKNKVLDWCSCFQEKKGIRGLIQVVFVLFYSVMFE